MYIEMKVYGFALDGIAQMPVIILKDNDDKHTIPVWINATESVHLAAEFIGRELSMRNGRKDVFTALIEKLGMRTVSVIVHGVKDGVFASSVCLANSDQEELMLDLHVSEAMLISLKYRLPVLVNSEVLGQVSSLNMSEDEFIGENNARRFVDFLDQLDPSDMGKYPM